MKESNKKDPIEIKYAKRYYGRCRAAANLSLGAGIAYLILIIYGGIVVDDFMKDGGLVSLIIIILLSGSVHLWARNKAKKVKKDIELLKEKQKEEN